jgi:hypothetical protein
MYEVEIYYKVRRAHFIEGVSIRELSRVYGMHRKTVRNGLYPRKFAIFRANPL